MPFCSAENPNEALDLISHAFLRYQRHPAGTNDSLNFRLITFGALQTPATNSKSVFPPKAFQPPSETLGWHKTVEQLYSESGMNDLITFVVDHPLVMLALGIMLVLYTMYKFNQLR